MTFKEYYSFADPGFGSLFWTPGFGSGIYFEISDPSSATNVLESSIYFLSTNYGTSMFVILLKFFCKGGTVPLKKK